MCMEKEIELENFDYAVINNKGSFLFLPLLYNSRYFGLLQYYNNNFIKIIEKIENRDINYNEIEKVILKDYNDLKIIYKDGWEEYKLIDNKLIYKTNKYSTLNVYFDIRYLYDMDEWGRIYNNEKNKDYVKIKFNKGDLNYEVIIRGFEVYQELNKWIKVNYNYDLYRKSPPFERYVYLPFSFYAKELEIIYKNDKENLNGNNLIENRLLSFIYDNNVSAGFPWYFQEWSRDLLISLNGLYYINKDIVKNKLIEYSNYFLLDGRLKNIKNENVGNSDGIGLYIFRLFQFKDLFEKELFDKLINNIIEKLKLFEDNYLDEKLFLFKAYPNETWMDTLNRIYPIEIQFLMANVYDSLYNYTKKDEYKEKLEKIKNSIRKNYLSDYSLYDDIKNKKIRCNVFLSYYFYPKIFSNYEWENIFDYSLTQLYLKWGGISSLSIFDKEFIPYSNEDNYFRNEGKSMHNGDSWIFINNIAAMDLYNLNKEKYSNIINSITKADERLIKMIGTLPERSSAYELKPVGALHQLWSISTYIELLNNIK